MLKASFPKMRTSSLLIYLVLALVAFLSSSFVSADVVEYTFEVGNVTVRRLCNERVIAAVNGSLPGPTINVREGDTLIVHAVNKSPYNLTLHWHGIFQLMSQWADGPGYVTQCPILPGGKYTYKFNVTAQEGTLWWHGHSSFLRAWVYGALIIRPRLGHSYPFPKPYQEVPIVLGEWWNANVIDVEEEAAHFGGGPNISDAYTINGLPGPLYNCSQNQTFLLKVQQGKTYLLRIINAALNEHLFFKIARHTFTVVAADAAYTNPYQTDIIVVAPGQTVDALLTANQKVASYFMAATPYQTLNGTNNNSTTTGIVVYSSKTTSPLMPSLPANNDTQTANTFYGGLTGLVGGPHWVPIPKNVDEHMFITIGIALDVCNLPNNTCRGPTTSTRLSASMNNESFVLPVGRRFSMLDAFYRNATNGVYTKDFPDQPPFVFNYTDSDGLNSNTNQGLAFAPKSTKVKTFKFNSTVQIVFQNTAILSPENHPIHIHGFNFHILAQGTGNYNASRDASKFNLKDPPIRNTVAVPFAGWAVIRFQANNPGIWLVHCHIDTHLTWGLSTAFEVENGPTPETTLPSPPLDLPTQC